MMHQALVNAGHKFPAETTASAGALADGGFKQGAIYGASTGFAVVLAGYFILKQIFRKSTTTDDFERA